MSFSISLCSSTFAKVFINVNSKIMKKTKLALTLLAVLALFIVSCSGGEKKQLISFAGSGNREKNKLFWIFAAGLWTYPSRFWKTVLHRSKWWPWIFAVKCCWKAKRKYLLICKAGFAWSVPTGCLTRDPLMARDGYLFPQLSQMAKADSDFADIWLLVL